MIFKDLSDRQWENDYERSKALRKRFREAKKNDAAISQDCRSLQEKHSLSIPVLPASESDAKIASLIKFDSK